MPPVTTYPRSGSRFGQYPEVGVRYGSHPAGGLPPLVAEQEFGLQVVASKLEPLVAAQSYDLTIVGSEGGVTALDPLTIVSADKVAYYNGDVGVAEAAAAGRCSQWSDQVGTAHRVQATAANQPNVVTVAGLNSRKGIQGTGSPMTMTGGPDRPAPGTTPTHIWTIIRTDTYSSAGNLIGVFSIRYGTTANTVRTNVGANGPEVAIANGNTYLMIAQFTNNALDTFKVGVNTGVGNAGNTNAAASTLFANATPANFGAGTIMCDLWKSAAFTPTELADLAVWAVSYYGASVIL